MSMFPKLLSANRVRQLAVDNYLRANFQKFLAEDNSALGPMSFNTPEDALQYLIDTAVPMKIVFLGLDDAPNEHGGTDVGGSSAYLISFSEIEITGEPDNRNFMKATLAFFTDEKNTFLVHPEATYRRLPLTMAKPDETTADQYVCAPDDCDQILKILRDLEILRTTKTDATT